VLAERQRTGEAERLPQIFEPAPGAVVVVRGPKHVLEIFNPANTALVGVATSSRSLPNSRTSPEATSATAATYFGDRPS
jgi:hypothetical protein